MTSRSLLFLLAFFSGVSFAQTQQHPDYIGGYQAWSEARWPTASELLTRYWRNEQYSKTYDVAFWLGTSWCRQSGKERFGVDLLDWSYQYHSMPERERAKFRDERDLCISWLRQSDQPRPRPVVVLKNVWSNATMRAEGKTYYVGRDKGGLSAYPVRLKRTLPEAQFGKRLIPLGEAEAATKLVQQLAPGFRIHVGKLFVIASMSPSHNDASLERIAAQLDKFAEFVRRAYGLEAPRHYVTVYLFPSIPDLRKWADRLHGLDASPLTLGYSLQNDLSVLAMGTTTQTGTVLHEIFHLIVRGGYGSVPQWLDEGIASLYETASVVGNDYFGEPNWRSRVFMEFANIFQRVRLRDVIQSPWFSDEPNLTHQPGERRLDPDEQAFMLAYARMFVLYLQERGLLVPVFNAFKNREAPEEYTPAAVQAVRLVEATVGKPLDEIEREFRAWTPVAANPDGRLRRGVPVEKELPSAAVTREVPVSFVDRD